MRGWIGFSEDEGKRWAAEPRFLCHRPACGRERDPPARFLNAKIEGCATAQRHPRTKNHAFVFTGLRMTKVWDAARAPSKVATDDADAISVLNALKISLPLPIRHRVIKRLDLQPRGVDVEFHDRIAKHLPRQFTPSK